MKNQEKVWKAERAETAEKQRMQDLEREINDERNREELKRIGQSSGVLAQTDDKKLEWMYKGPADLLNREEYLLGRRIDKTFEQLDAEEKTGNLIGVQVPKNHVEHECIPFSIRAFKGVDSKDQVDMQRKIMEDPLMAIKQKEMETRRKILENPVKLKELHRMLKADKSRKTKSSKKAKKSKKSKSKRSSSSSSSSSNSDDDLDKLLVQKYKKLQDNEEGSGNIDLKQLLSAKYEKLNKELDKMAGKSKKSQKHSSENSDASSDSEIDSRKRQNSNRRDRSNSRDRSNYRNNVRPANDWNRNRNFYERRPNFNNNRGRPIDRYESSRNYRNRGNQYDQRIENRRHRSRSPDHQSSRQNRDKYRPSSIRESKSRGSRRESRDRTKSPKRKQSPESRKRNESSSRSPSPKRIRKNSDDDDEKDFRQQRNYGLIKADGSKIEISKKSYSHYDNEKNHKETKKLEIPIPKKKQERLSSIEKEIRLKAMMDNAKWRNVERERNVKSYKKDDDDEQEKLKQDGFDKGFMNKELKKAMANQSSIESRIRSNLNNIQRSSRTMDQNFARR